MRDRANKESAGEQYQRLAQECLEMVPTIEDREGRAALIEMARVWLRLAEIYKANNSIPPAATKDTRRQVMKEQQQAQPKEDADKD
jgi:hypothetical protein